MTAEFPQSPGLDVAGPGATGDSGAGAGAADPGAAANPGAAGPRTTAAGDAGARQAMEAVRREVGDRESGV
ncbi:MAG: hypothetical protein LBI49_18310 [Nocardiopsaceae bacterium]|nr:hypothetical protein [Nocardiopsaceae bacterium]